MKIKLVTTMLMLAVFTVPLVPGRTLSAQDSPRTINITARRFAYDPAELTIKKGQPVVLILHSADVAHGLKFRELNLDVKVNKGGTAELRFTPDKMGDFVGHCSVFCGSGHGSMTLTLHIVE